MKTRYKVVMNHQPGHTDSPKTFEFDMDGENHKAGEVLAHAFGDQRAQSLTGEWGTQVPSVFTVERIPIKYTTAELIGKVFDGVGRGQHIGPDPLDRGRVSTTHIVVFVPGREQQSRYHIDVVNDWIGNGTWTLRS